LNRYDFGEIKQQLVSFFEEWITEKMIACEKILNVTLAKCGYSVRLLSSSSQN